jgi:hypothetical protein
MAGFCTRCGAPLSDGIAFCTKCGTPVGAAAAATPPAQVPYVPPVSNAPAAYTPVGAYTPPAAASAPPGAAYTPPAAYASPGTTPPQKSGSSALKIVLIIVAVFVGLGVLSVAGIMFGIYRVSKAVHVSDNGKGVELTVPGAGTFSAGDTPVSASDLGVDPYPGASQQKGSLKINTPKGTMITAIYETGDSTDKVIDYYKDKLGSGASVMQSDKGAVLTLTDDAKKTTVMVTVGTSDGKTTISVMRTVGS